MVEENHSFADVIGNSDAPFINATAAGGALFTRSFGVTHPSEPNYLALYSGSTQGLTDDSCPHSYHAANLGAELVGAGLSFAGYSESLPSAGYTGCSSGSYARKHAPWADFDAPAGVNRSVSQLPGPADYRSLPTVSFVIPNLDHDMHDGSIASADRWLTDNLAGYARWASSHHSLLILTWDEDDFSPRNQIATIIYGQAVKPGRYSQPITHLNLLRTLEQAYGLSYAGSSAGAAPITGIWR